MDAGNGRAAQWPRRPAWGGNAAIDRAVGAGPSEGAKQQCAAAFADAWHADWGGGDRVPATTWEAIETLYRYLVGAPRLIKTAEAE